MARRVVQTDKAPAAIGPYSQAVVSDGWIFLSGQIALDPATGQLVGESVQDQTERILKNLATVLQAAGSSLGSVVKTSVFLADMNDFASMNEIYGRSFPDNPPARSTIQAACLPKNAKVEIDAIALVEK